MPIYHFISGLPRSGSTLLAAILRQNPRFHAGMTSPVGSLVSAVQAQFSAGSEFAPVVSTDQRRALLKGLFSSFYADVDRPVIFDTNRNWCARLPAILDLFPEAKIIACVRHVGWIMDSIERLYRKNPFENTLLFGNATNIYTRLEGLAKHDRLVGNAWSAVREAFYSDQAKSMLVIDYDLLAAKPQRVIELVYEFIGEPHFAHDFNNVAYDAPEFDLGLGVGGLHKVRPVVEFVPRRMVIPPDLFERFAQMTFWNDAAGSDAYVIAARPNAAALSPTGMAT